MLTVNVTCVACDGTRPCAECRAAGKTLEAAGYRVQHSSRAAALRAALAGTYGFEACVVPLAANERSVADAAVALLGGSSVALAVDDPAVLPEELPPRFSVFERSAFRAGRLPADWPGSSEAAPARAAGQPRAADDRDHATRRLRPHVAAARVKQQSKDRAGVRRVEARALIDDEIAWCKASGALFSIVLVRAPDADEALISRLLAGAVREGDGVGRRDSDYVLVLAHANREGAGAIAKRLEKILRSSKARARVSIGIASYPADAASSSALLAHASVSM
ncbi:MAG TPA: hypothetical protein VN934_11305 [Candidatus Tumulicola sp.]|nr:hypothetical protein [Candidatus Tumulicola sp.]